MPTRPWFAFNPGDYLRDTQDLSLEEHGAYLLLICYAWEHDGEVPDSQPRIARILGIHTNKAKTLWGKVGGYWYKTHGGYGHKRIKREIAHAVEIYGKRAEAGKKGGLAKAKAIAVANALPTNNLQPTEKKEIHKERVNGHDPAFQKWWQAYPKKKAKAVAEKAWNKLSLEEREKASRGLVYFKFEEDPKFIPYPASWLNGHRWEDEVVDEPTENWRDFEP